VLGGEVLSDHDRRLLGRAFPGIQVFETYNSTEIDSIAYECQAHRGLHLQETLVLVEVLDQRDRPVPPGEVGRMVVTDLVHDVFPLIRYDGLGDLVALHPDHACPCGRQSRRIRKVLGREIELFRLPDGTELHPFLLDTAVYPIPGLLEYQFVQQAVDRIEMRVVAEEGNAAAREALLAVIESAVRPVLRGQAALEVSWGVPPEVKPGTDKKPLFISRISRLERRRSEGEPSGRSSEGDRLDQGSSG
jgi:phenylacetate-CoA ligase